MANKGHTSISTRHRWSCRHPAGLKFTFSQMSETEQNVERDNEAKHADGGAEPVFIALGNGTVEWSASVLADEWRQFLKLLAAQGVAFTDIDFDWARITKTRGLETDDEYAVGCRVASANATAGPDGNMVELSGPALNVKRGGAWAFERRT